MKLFNSIWFDHLHMCSKRQVKQEINRGIPNLSYRISTAADLTDVGNPLHMQDIGLSEKWDQKEMGRRKTNRTI